MGTNNSVQCRHPRSTVSTKLASDGVDQQILESLPMKHKLSLAYLGVTSPPEDVIRNFGSSIIEMDMSYNKVSDLKFLQEMPLVKSLVLDHNLISSHVQMPFCSALETLWVNHNKIENLGLFIATLAKNCPNLRILSMMNNLAAPSYFNGGTYQQFMDYRYFVMTHLPKLEIVDDRSITPEERAEAQRLYPKPLVKSKRSGRSSSSRRKASKTSSESSGTSTDSADASSVLGVTEEEGEHRSVSHQH